MMDAWSQPTWPSTRKINEVLLIEEGHKDEPKHVYPSYEIIVSEIIVSQLAKKHNPSEFYRKLTPKIAKMAPVYLYALRRPYRNVPTGIPS